MARPRCEQIDLKNGGFVHLGNRCVRQAYICGFDSLTGKDFSHRRGWIERRLLFLASVFSVEVFGYSILDNHYHLLANFVPKNAERWSGAEVVRRWLLLYPKKTSEATEEFIETTISDPERLEELRERLCTPPYFMKELNQYIARLANHEDDVKGAFWGGRYFSKALKTEEDIVSCLAYVDLNPVRAGMVSDPESPEQQTSLVRRLEELKALQAQESKQAAVGSQSEQSAPDDSDTMLPAVKAGASANAAYRPLQPLARGNQALIARTLETGSKLPITLDAYRHRLSVLAQHGAGKPRRLTERSREPPGPEAWLESWLERMKKFRRKAPVRTPLYWWMSTGGCLLADDD